MIRIAFFLSSFTHSLQYLYKMLCCRLLNCLIPWNGFEGHCSCLDCFHLTVFIQYNLSLISSAYFHSGLSFYVIFIQSEFICSYVFIFTVMTPLNMQHIYDQSKPSLSKQMIVERKRKWKDIRYFSLPLPKCKSLLHFITADPLALERCNSFQINMCMYALTDVGRGRVDYF